MPSVCGTVPRGDSINRSNQAGKTGVAGELTDVRALMTEALEPLADVDVRLFAPQLSA
jgi:hypothetical protein